MELRLDLELVDRDGALRETEEALPRETRRDVLAGALLGGAAFALLAEAEPARAATRGDVAILNYALVLEYLQSSFYTEAERRKALKTRTARQTARVLGAVERAHVTALEQALGRAAVKRPFFDFRGTTEDEDAFIRTGVAFEDLGAAAYKGQAYRIESRPLLQAAISIHSVEARHAAWIRYLAGTAPASAAFDEPKSMAEVNRLVASTGFIVRRPATRSRRRPKFTG